LEEETGFYTIYTCVRFKVIFLSIVNFSIQLHLPPRSLEAPGRDWQPEDIMCTVFWIARQCNSKIDASEELIASIFSVKKEVSQETTRNVPPVFCRFFGLFIPRS
jgi:hypothetical protein